LLLPESAMYRTYAPKWIMNVQSYTLTSLHLKITFRDGYVYFEYLQRYLIVQGTAVFMIHDFSVLDTCTGDSIVSKPR
jgi:hypothetical protein